MLVSVFTVKVHTCTTQTINDVTTTHEHTKMNSTHHVHETDSHLHIATINTTDLQIYQCNVVQGGYCRSTQHSFYINFHEYDKCPRVEFDLLKLTS